MCENRKLFFLVLNSECSKECIGFNIVLICILSHHRCLHIIKITRNLRTGTFLLLEVPVLIYYQIKVPVSVLIKKFFKAFGFGTGSLRFVCLKLPIKSDFRGFGFGSGSKYFSTVLFLRCQFPWKMVTVNSKEICVSSAFHNILYIVIYIINHY